MLTNLKIFDISDALSNITEISDMFPGGITNEKPLGVGKEKPWMYVTKFEYGEKNNLTKRAHIEVNIEGGPSMVADELEDMFIVIDNNLLPNVDGCLPIKKFGNTTIISIEQGSMTQAMRDAKENIIMRKTYTFTYITQN